MTKNKNNIIVSADDFGKSKLANRNILHLAESGRLDRVSVMTDGEFGAEDLKRLISSGVDLDIHLHLKNRMEKREKIREGFVKRGLIFLSNYLFGVFSLKRVEREWDDQIKKFEKMIGRNLDGLNAHRYDHLFPVYFPLAVKLARANNISHIRFGKIVPGDRNLLASSIIFYFRRKNEKLFLSSDLESFAFCGNLDWMSEPDIFLNEPREGEVELVVHPEREEEYKFVKNFKR